VCGNLDTCIQRLSLTTSIALAAAVDATACSLLGWGTLMRITWCRRRVKTD
jgi:hypothetical protein